MGRLYPEYWESAISILDNILMYVYECVEENPDLNQNDLFKEVFQEFYEQRKKVENPFSEGLLRRLEDFFIERYDIDKDLFQITENTEKNLIQYCLDLFIQRFSHIEGIEISEVEYIRKSYTFLYKCLKEFKLDNDKILTLEKWLMVQFKKNWKDFSRFWQQYKEEMMDEIEILKIAFKNFGEGEFFKTILNHKPILECTKKKEDEENRRQKKYMESEEFKKSHQQFVNKIKNKHENH